MEAHKNIDSGLGVVIWKVKWLHYLNNEAITCISSTHHWFDRERYQVRLSYPTDGVIEFHMSFLYLVCLEKVFASDHMYYRW